MRRGSNSNSSSSKGGRNSNGGLLPNSLRIISSCLKTVSNNATNVASSVRSAGASVASSISSSSSSSSDDHQNKDQVIWAGFDKIELGPSAFKHVLLLGYQTGFQVLDVENASNFSELVSKRDGPVTFLQMQPIPDKSTGKEGFRTAHPLLLVVAGDDSGGLSLDKTQNSLGVSVKDGIVGSQSGSSISSPTSVRFYSLRSHSYVHVLRFRSAVLMIRCSPRIVAVGLANQIYCFDASTLENKLSVLTYPVPQLSGQGPVGVNVGYGPMAVGPRWLAYASNSTFSSNLGRLSPQSITSSPSGSPSTSPGSGNLVARYAMESGKNLAAGIINLGDMGCKTFSKYCQELLPDGSNSPVSSNSGWKVAKAAGAETDNAGVVVIRDFFSRVVISQFKAHTSPISALCFDPSGTLLVTASVYGKDINVFRIMLPHNLDRSGARSCEWDSSHVHLYKLHRGILPAIIQDVCFSHSSQWIAIVSSKGTCHVFILSPFGGDTGFQTQDSEGEEPSLSPIVSPPWWSTSPGMIDQQIIAPPPSVSLSAVSRIKYNDSGWLNTVSNAAATATGKVFVPSGAVAAIFHNTLPRSHQRVNSSVNALEYILVYTPSGHVIQHKLLPSVGRETNEGNAKIRPGSFLQIQEDELKVKVEPVQWWDVCRRSDWPEREECIFGTKCDGQGVTDMMSVISDHAERNSEGMLDVNSRIGRKQYSKVNSSKPHDRASWYLSNAEVQINSGRYPLWYKSMINFYVMSSPKFNDYVKSEFEIEKALIHEVEIKRKELLPVFDHFHSIKHGWSDRSHDEEKYPAFSHSEPHQAKEKVAEESIMCYSKPASLCSTESSEAGSSRRIENLIDLDQMNIEKSHVPGGQILNEFYVDQKGRANLESSLLDQKSSASGLLTSDPSTDVNSSGGNCNPNGLLPSKSNMLCIRKCSSKTTPSLDNGGIGEDSIGDFGSTLTKNSVEGPALLVANEPVKKLQRSQNGQCKTPDLDSREVSEAAKDDFDSNSSHCEREKLEDEGENEEMIGEVFAFSEG